MDTTTSLSWGSKVYNTTNGPLLVGSFGGVLRSMLMFGFSLLNQMIELSDLYRKSVVSKRPYVVPHLGFEEILDDLDVPIFGRHTALGDPTTVAMAYIKLKRSR